MTPLEIIHIVLTTTEDTSTTLYRCLRGISKIDKQIILKELNRPYIELEKEYIFSKIYHVEDKNNHSLNFHYKKGKDDINISSNPLLREEATMNWLSRKESELLKALSLINIDYYETINIGNFELIKDELFGFLIEKKFIHEQSDKNIFNSIFIGNTIYEQPKIKWLKDVQYFNMFFHLLHHFGLINLNSKEEAISKKVKTGDFFVNGLKEDKSFALLSKRKIEFEKKLFEYLHDKNKAFKELKDLEEIIKKIKQIK
ncbi:MAG: hypothetical protein PSN34_07000 [Urechidicola sp.]|nr:hypothetical protein [Urechidicola sp.]